MIIIFAVAAVLTPPDPVTQIGLAVPLLLLYELSIISVKVIEKKAEKKEFTVSIKRCEPTKNLLQIYMMFLLSE